MPGTRLRLLTSQLLEVAEDLVGMAPEVLHVVDLAHHAVGIDQKRPPAGDGRPVVVGRAGRAVGLADLVVDVGQEAVRKALVVGERLVLVRDVE